MALHNRKGAQAEELACKHLRQQGLKLITRNFNVPYGEIDLIMREADTTVFIEVRYRSRSDFGSPAESVDYRKRQRLIRAAAGYLQSNPKLANHPSRFDVVSIDDSQRVPQINWIKNAFMAE